ncbi:MAG: flagellar hook-basal body complex protein FliE [Tagaea sp.]|jgi:flagellar hook-basal body complex protein FliE
MAINPAAVTAAYSGAQAIGRSAGLDGRGSGDVASFGDVLADAARSSMGALKAGEQASLRALAGKADVAQVVQAVSAAEVTLQTAVAVRDRVVSAYQEIIRMQI